MDSARIVEIYREQGEGDPLPVGTLIENEDGLQAIPATFQFLLDWAQRQGYDPMAFYANWTNGYLTTKELEI